MPKFCFSAIMLLALFVTSGCGWSRKVKKQETTTDTVAQKAIDSVAVKSIFQQRQSDKTEKTVTTFLPGRDTIIYVTQPNGEIQVVPVQMPPQIIKIEQDNAQRLNEIFSHYDSLHVADSSRFVKATVDTAVTKESSFNWSGLLPFAILCAVMVAGFVLVFSRLSQLKKS